jgi:hypothetical protein
MRVMMSETLAAGTDPDHSSWSQTNLGTHSTDYTFSSSSLEVKPAWGTASASELDPLKILYTDIEEGEYHTN